MCYAIPAVILEQDGDTAVVDYGGVRKKVNVRLVDAGPGDYVLVHAGFAIEKLEKQSAKESLQIIRNQLRIANGNSQ